MSFVFLNADRGISEWKAAAHTYLGTTISGYPNMFRK